MWPCSCELIKTMQRGYGLKVMALNQRSFKKVFSFSSFAVPKAAGSGNQLITTIRFYSLLQNFVGQFAQTERLGDLTNNLN